MTACGAQVPFTVLSDVLETWMHHGGWMARYPHGRSQRSNPKPTPLWLAGVGAFAIAYVGATYVLSPDAPGKAQLRREWSKRTTDQQYSGCGQARTNKHENIASWEPSYRSHMDGDGDGLACEPYR